MALYRLLPARLLVPWLLLLGGRRARLLQRHGFGKSVRTGRPVDENDRPIPYLPYCVIRLLDERLPSDAHVLEFGSGFSTLYFMNRTKTVTSIEHDQRWVQRLKAQTNGNVTLLDAPRDPVGEYVDAIERAPLRRFDLILVDGIHRVEAFARALASLTERGVVILDDSWRSAYSLAYPLAEAQGFRALRLQGHKPGELNLSESTVFYRDGNCLGL